MDLLRILFDEIGERCAAVAADQPNWPCRRGCDECCRRLADIPRVTDAEFRLIQELLTPEIEERFAAMSADAPPYTCPLLDSDGACSIYHVRPLACRTYGFYRERDAGLHCSRISGDEPVVWGNAGALRARAAELGAELPITEHLRRHRS